MFPKIPFIPKITNSREKFIAHIISICEGNVEEETEEAWVDRVRMGICLGHYFVGMIFFDWGNFTFYTILHEFIHHVSCVLRYLTQSPIWFKIDYLIDDLDCFLFRK